MAGTVRSSGTAERVDGHVLVPGDDGYDAARTVWNAMVDHRPRVIVRCTSVEDVVRAVRVARRRDLEIGVRCGGHSVVGHAVPEDGAMLDLTPMGRVQVDPARRRARVQGGALLGALDRAAQRHGLATTAGNVSHTGVGGLTLGGGMGWLARQHGLSCDNVVSFELVTAEGRVLRVSEREHAELFWGLRGGGGNFGIVTEFEFALHPVCGRTVVAELEFALAEAAPVLAGWRDLSAMAPRQATATASVSGDRVTVGVVWVDGAEAERRELPGLLASLRALGRPLAERVLEPSYFELQTRDDDVRGHARRRYWKGHYLRELGDDAIDALLSRGPLAPNMSLQAYGGAIADVPDEATAFSHRATRFELVAAAVWTDPAEDEARIAAARRHAAALEPFASGVYVNALSDEGAAGVRRAYPPEKLARLTALKDLHDPDNVFHLNHNVRPSRA